MRIALGGGGGAEQSRAIDRVFASWLEPGRPLLYIPNAMGTDSETAAAAHRWIRSTFAPLTTVKIEMRTDLDEIADEDLQGASGVYIGGGNTYDLLLQVRVSGLDARLKRAVEGGLPAYGGSAGAALFGADIATVAHMDENTVGLAHTHGLNLAGGHAVWVHYAEGDARMISSFARETGQDVIAVAEDAGVVVVTAGIFGVGNGASVRYGRDGSVKPLPRWESKL